MAASVVNSRPKLPPGSGGRPGSGTAAQPPPQPGDRSGQSMLVHPLDRGRAVPGNPEEAETDHRSDGDSDQRAEDQRRQACVLGGRVDAAGEDVAEQ